MTGKQRFKTLQQGMTLLELSVVLLILIALAGLTVPYVSGIGSTPSCRLPMQRCRRSRRRLWGEVRVLGFMGILWVITQKPLSTAAELQFNVSVFGASG